MKEKSNDKFLVDLSVHYRGLFCSKQLVQDENFPKLDIVRCISLNQYPARSRSIGDLSGLEELWVRDNQIADLSALQPLQVRVGSHPDEYLR